MQTLNETVVKALKNASIKELKLADRTIRRALTKNVSIDDALMVEQFNRGDNVTYLNHRGEIRPAKVEKVNSVRIRLFDKKAKVAVSVKPDAIKPVVRKPREAKVKPTVQ